MSKLNAKTKKEVIIFIIEVTCFFLILNFAIVSAVRYLIFADQTCFTQDQINADSRCLYILNGNVYEKGTRSSPHHGHACGSDVTDVIKTQPFHEANPAFYLDPNLRGSICQIAPTSTPTIAPTNTIAPPTTTPTTPPTQAPTVPVAASPTPTQVQVANTSTPASTNTNTSVSNIEPSKTPTTAKIEAKSNETKNETKQSTNQQFGSHQIQNDTSYPQLKTEETISDKNSNLYINIVKTGTIILSIFGSGSALLSLIVMILNPKK